MVCLNITSIISAIFSNISALPFQKSIINLDRQNLRYYLCFCGLVENLRSTSKFVTIFPVKILGNFPNPVWKIRHLGCVIQWWLLPICFCFYYFKKLFCSVNWILENQTISHHTAILVANALVSNHLDYCMLFIAVCPVPICTEQCANLLEQH